MDKNSNAVETPKVLQQVENGWLTISIPLISNPQPSKVKVVNGVEKGGKNLILASSGGFTGIVNDAGKVMKVNYILTTPKE